MFRARHSNRHVPSSSGAATTVPVPRQETIAADSMASPEVTRHFVDTISLAGIPDETTKGPLRFLGTRSFHGGAVEIRAAGLSEDNTNVTDPRDGGKLLFLGRDRSSVHVVSFARSQPKGSAATAVSIDQTIIRGVYTENPVIAARTSEPFDVNRSMVVDAGNYAAVRFVPSQNPDGTTDAAADRFIRSGEIDSQQYQELILAARVDRIMETLD